MPVLSPRRRRGRRAESFIANYELPYWVRRKFERDAPEIEWNFVERGLREWLICCAYRRGRQLGMPSRAVDYAWHAFILDTAAYRDFCQRAYGDYLDHVPESVMTEGSEATLLTVWAWDQSRAARAGESILWDLDERLDLEEPLGVGEAELRLARSRFAADGGFPGDGGGGFFDGGGGCGGGGCGGGGG